MKKKKCKVSEMKYILISQRSKNRILVNLDKLIISLKNRFNYSIIVYDDRHQNLKDVCWWFTFATVVIGYHGSGLTNIYLCNTNTTVIELSSYIPNYAFAKIGSQIGLNYYVYKIPSYRYIYSLHKFFNISTFISTLSYYNTLIWYISINMKYENVNIHYFS